MLNSISKKLICAFILAASFGSFSTPTKAEEYQSYISIPKPAAGTNILVFTPQISLAELTAAGTADPKTEWNDNCRKYISDEINARLVAMGYKTSTQDPNAIAEPRAVQIIKLNDVVDTAIAIHANNSSMLKLPTKPTFDWTLGEGASTLVPEAMRGTTEAPKYALFTDIKGTFSSDGRKALMVAALIGGTAIPMGGQVIKSSLVDLSTGQVVWHYSRPIGGTGDVRTLDGSKALLDKVYENLPLNK